MCTHTGVRLPFSQRGCTAGCSWAGWCGKNSWLCVLLVPNSASLLWDAQTCHNVCGPRKGATSLWGVTCCQELVLWSSSWQTPEGVLRLRMPPSPPRSLNKRIGACCFGSSFHYVGQRLMALCSLLSGLSSGICPPSPVHCYLLGQASKL